MRNFTKKALLFLVFAILGVTMINAQGGGSIAPQEITKSTTNITLKTFRALFPGQPVAVANEIFGGLHSVADVDSLHGKDGVLNDAELQTGMLIYVASTNMYYRYKGADSNGVNGVTNAVFDVDGVNTNYWESLADVLAAVMGTHVYDDTLGLGADIYEGDVYLAGDTTFVWDGDNWTTMSLTEVDSVYEDRDMFDIPVSGDVAVETDTTYIFDGNDWIVAGVQPSVTMDSIFSIANGDVRTDEGNTIGDIYIAADTTFAWNGDSWETLVLSEVDSVYTDRLAYDSPNSGDVAVETDTTYIFDGNEWLVASVQPSVTMDSVFVGDRTSLTANLVGDIVNDKDSIFVWKGDDWELISVLPSAEVDSFPIFYSLDGTAHFNETVKASDMDDYRSKMVLNDALKQFHGENDVYLYYPAAWGNFTYSIVYGGEKISLTNGIDIETIAATGQVGEVYVHVPYKQVKISSGNQIVEID